MKVCDTTYNATVLGEAETEAEALAILIGTFLQQGRTISAVKQGSVFLMRSDPELGRLITAWIPARHPDLEGRDERVNDPRVQIDKNVLRDREAEKHKVTAEHMHRLKTLDLHDPFVRAALGSFLASHYNEGGSISAKAISQVLTAFAERVHQVLDEVARRNPGEDLGN